MTEERLEEIKDSIIIQKIACKANKGETELIDEEIELYNEVVRLRKESENFIYLLQRIKPIIPTYYNDLIDETNEALKKYEN